MIKENKKLIFVLGFILVFYIWVGGTASSGFNPDRNIYNYYNMLTDGFLGGKLHLLVQPRPEILRLDNPYDFETVNKYSKFYLWDTCFYHRKYYIYNSIVPIVFVYLPYKFLFKIGISDYLVTTIFMFLGLVFTVLTLKKIWNKYFNHLPEWIFLLCVLTLGFSNIAPHMLRRLAQYQVAISSGYFFLNASIFFLYKASSEVKNISRNLLIASFLFGLSVLSRFDLIFGIAIFFLVWKKISDKKSSLLYLGQLLIPMLMCFVFQGLYNYLRFDDFLEFGSKYHLGLKSKWLFGFDYIVTGLYLYLVNNLYITSEFPFVYCASFFPPYLKIPKLSYIERTTGIFTTVPNSIFFIAHYGIIGFFNKPFSEKLKKNFPKFEFNLFFLPGITILLVLAMLNMFSMRYSTDFTTLLLSASFIIFFQLYSLLFQDKKKLKIINYIFIAFSLISIYNGFAFSVIGCEIEVAKYGLLAHNPEQYYFLKNLFEPVSKIIFKLLGR